jgi:hypothetical protein
MTSSEYLDILRRKSMEKVIAKEIREGKWKEKEEKWANWATKLGFCSRLSSLEMCRKVC